MSRKAHLARLLAAVSVLGVSVGMTAAVAEDSQNKGVLIGLSKQDKHANQLKYESTQDKWHSSQIKGENNYLKYESSQDKWRSNQDKWHSSQIKGESSQIKLDATQMKYSTQQKVNSTQTKIDAGALNPQPEPPGRSPTGQ